MRIVDEKEVVSKGHACKKTLNAGEKWLFSKPAKGKMVILEMLKQMQVNKAAVAELSEFHAFGSKAKASGGLDSALNRVFIFEQSKLIARGNGDKIVIRKTETFDINKYSKADRRQMPAGHEAVVMENLELLENSREDVRSTTSRMPDD